MPPAACCDTHRLKESLFGEGESVCRISKAQYNPRFPLGALWEASGPLYRMLASMNNRCALRSCSELLAVSIIEMAVAVFFAFSREEANSNEVASLRHLELTAAADWWYRVHRLPWPVKLSGTVMHQKWLKFRGFRGSRQLLGCFLVREAARTSTGRRQRCCLLRQAKNKKKMHKPNVARPSKLRVLGNTRLMRQTLVLDVYSTWRLIKQRGVSQLYLLSSTPPGWVTHLVAELSCLNPAAPGFSGY